MHGLDSLLRHWCARTGNTWLNDLEAFCSFRGAFVHMSRTTQRASHLAVNPHDPGKPSGGRHRRSGVSNFASCERMQEHPVAIIDTRTPSARYSEIVPDATLSFAPK